MSEYSALNLYSSLLGTHIAQNTRSVDQNPIDEFEDRLRIVRNAKTPFTRHALFQATKMIFARKQLEGIESHLVPSDMVPSNIVVPGSTIQIYVVTLIYKYAFQDYSLRSKPSLRYHHLRITFHRGSIRVCSSRRLHGGLRRFLGVPPKYPTPTLSDHHSTTDLDRQDAFQTKESHSTNSIAVSILGLNHCWDRASLCPNDIWLTQGSRMVETVERQPVTEIL